MLVETILIKISKWDVILKPFLWVQKDVYFILLADLKNTLEDGFFSPKRRFYCNKNRLNITIFSILNSIDQSLKID